MFRMRKAAVCAILSLGLITTACAASNGGGSNASSGQVRIGITPYFEYQPWVIADKLGLDKKQGLDFRFTKMPGPTEAIQAVARGDLDVASTCHSCSFPLYKSVPKLRDWMITDQFKGFIIIGRKGETHTFDELSAKIGDAAAKKQILQEMKGKTFTMREVAYKPLVTAALAQVGLDASDIKITDFPDDAKAALAFLRGTGDYYFGSLPQEAKMLMQYGDKYVNVGGTDILGPAGLWYSTMASSEEWLSENPEVAEKMLAVWYRTMRYLKEQPEKTMPIFTKEINAATASSLSQKEVHFIVTQLDSFMTLEQAKRTAYNHNSELYWKRSAKFYAKGNELPDDFEMDKYIQDEKYFQKLLNNRDLVSWVNKPLS